MKTLARPTLCVLLFAIAQAAFAKQAPIDQEARSLSERVSRADFSTIPIIRQWLDRATFSKVEDASRFETIAAIDGAGQFGLEELGPQLVAIYQRAADDPEIRGEIAEAVVEMRSPASRGFLEVLRDDPSLDLANRLEALGVLYELGDQRAGDQLVELCRRSFADWKNRVNKIHHVNLVLREIGDPKMIERITAIRDGMKDKEVQKHATVLVNRMRLNNASPEELMAVLEETDYKKVYNARHFAFDVMAKKGGLEMIPRIAALKPWTNTATTKSADAMREMLAVEQSGAIAAIKRRHWRELSRSPATQP